MSVTLLARVMEKDLTEEVLLKKEITLDCSKKWKSLKLETRSIENVLIIDTNDIYVCDQFVKNNKDKSILCKDFKALGVPTAKAFNMDAFMPELMVSFEHSGHEQFIRTEFNLQDFLEDVKNKAFIKYFVVRSTLLSNPKWVEENLKENYRVVEVGDDLKIKKPYKYKDGKFLDWSKGFSAEQKSFDDLISINGDYLIRNNIPKNSKFEWSMLGGLSKGGQKRLKLMKQIRETIKEKGYFIADEFQEYRRVFFNFEVFSDGSTSTSNKEDKPMDSVTGSVHSESEKEVFSSDPILKPTNTILYGPPGTGKTYQTVNKAVEILDGVSINKTREALKMRFDDLVNEDRIVFTTFHQSMCYEDFIEGIKPVLDENEADNKQVGYEIEDGIFKKLCVEAAFDLFKKDGPETENSPIEFMDIYNNFVDSVEDRLDKGEDVVLDSKTGSKLIITKIDSKRNIVIKHDNGSKEYPVSYANLLILHKKYPNLAIVDNMMQSFRKVSGISNSTCYWAVLNELRKEKAPEKGKSDKIYIYDDKKNMLEALTRNNEINSEAQDFVLIIDEINRGNVSQIFGEIITLIEEDKRLGMKEALKVMLPYSKKEFGVPANLHIIGTMNTADRSVEALDTALRRRFTFEEIVPQPELISKYGEGDIVANGVYISLPEILKTINNRLLILTDRDHLIGHSYFMKVTDLSGLRQVMYNNVIPLLQEYFYGDYGKIGLVLGGGFVEVKDTKTFRLAEFNDYDRDNYSERKIYDIVQNQEDVDFIEAIDKLLSGKSIKIKADDSSPVDTAPQA